MARTMIVGAALLGLITAVPAAQTAPEFDADRIKAHVTFLADDLLEGRETGTRGHEIAARYVAAQLALLGVKPGGPDGSYFQIVDLLEASLTGPTPTVTLATQRSTERLENGRDAMIDGSIAGGELKLKAPVVFVGYGMKDPTLGYDDYQGLDVRGKIVLALWGSPKGIDSEVGAHLQSQQGRVAAEHGAAAILFVMTKATASAFPWEKVIELIDRPLTTWVRKDGTPFDPRYGLKASALLNANAAAALFDGSSQTLERILEEAEKAGGRPTGFALKSTAEITVATKVRRFSSPEVIGLVEGSEARLKNEYVVLMGHSDHIGLKAGEGDRINNGAIDNAAGTAILIEVARAFKAAADPPRRSVLIVANTGEEQGLLGAEYFAHYPPANIEQITAAIDLDMPMLLYEFTDVVAYGAGHSTLQEVFENAGAAMGVKLSPDPAPEQAVFVRSDHYAMVKAGVPAVMLATGMANGGEAAWGKFLASHYHQPSDDLSLPIVWKAGAKFAELNYRALRMLADDERRARWYARDYFGNLYAPNAPKVAKTPGQ